MAGDASSVWEPGQVPLVNANGTVKSQLFTAIAAQSVFNLTNFVYVVNTESLQVYKNGLILVRGTDFTETTTDSFTLTSPAALNDKIYAIGFVGITGTVNIPGAGTVTVSSLAGGFLLPLANLTPVDIIHGGTGYSTDNTLAGLKAYLGISVAASVSSQDLLNVIVPSITGEGWKDIIRGGWFPAFFNQDWGGAINPMWIIDEFSNTEVRLETHTGCIDGVLATSVGNVAGQQLVGQGFKVGRALAAENLELWVRMYKVLNPTGTWAVNIYNDSAGVPTGAALFTTNLTDVIGLTTDTNGEWVRIAFTGVTLSANTQYHFALAAPAVDAANFVNIKTQVRPAAVNRDYPFGNLSTATSAPVWTAVTTTNAAFFIRLPSKETLQSGGLFDSKLVFNESVILPKSQALCNQVNNVWNGSEGTWLFTGQTWAIGKTFFDCIWGIDNNRFLAYVDGSGNVVFQVIDTFGTVKTVTSAGINVSVGTHQIMLALRAKADGLDYIKLYIDGAAAAAGTSNDTIQFDILLKELGTCWLGGGFSSAPTWTQKLNFNVLPSADSPAWTFTGTAVEATAFRINNGKMFQNAGGMTALLTANYSRTGLALANATGWAVSTKLRADLNLNPTARSSELQINDGTKSTFYQFHASYIVYSQTGAAVVGNQIIPSGRRAENQYLITGKLSDEYLFINGRFVRDGSGKLTNAVATNSILFGDNDATSSNNSQVQYDFLSFLNTGMFIPNVSTGFALSEFVCYIGDKTTLAAAYWNAGTVKSVKALAGISVGYINKIDLTEYSYGVTVSPTTTSVNTPDFIPEMGRYIYGSNIYVESDVSYSVSIISGPIVYGFIDGINFLFNQKNHTARTVSDIMGVGLNYTRKTYFGLHKAEIKLTGNTAGTVTHNTIMRQLTVRAEV